MGTSPRLAGAFLIASAAAVLALTLGPGVRTVHVRPAASATGILTASGAGQAILHAAALAPGHTAHGQVTVHYASSSDGRVGLVQRLDSETPGLGGGRLFDGLLLTIQQVNGHLDGLVYSGPMAAMGPTALRPFRGNESRTYSFAVAMPDTGEPPGPLAGDNALQGGSVTVDYDWSADSLNRIGSGRCRHGELGTSGSDAITAGALGVRILGRSGDDRIDGSRAADCLFGGRGNDVVLGRRGGDVLHGGLGEDVLRGGAGNDRLRASDGAADRLHCGAGSDTAIIDSLDEVTGCQQVIVR